MKWHLIITIPCELLPEFRMAGTLQKVALMPMIGRDENGVLQKACWMAAPC